MRFFIMTTLRELEHGTRARFSRVCDLRLHSCHVEQNPFSNAVSRGSNRSWLDPREHFGSDRETSDDDVGAPRVESGNSKALFGRHALQRLENVLDFDAGD